MKYQTDIIPKESKKNLRNNRCDKTENKQQGDGFKPNHISKSTLNVNDLNKIKMYVWINKTQVYLC